MNGPTKKRKEEILVALKSLVHDERMLLLESPFETTMIKGEVFRNAWLLVAWIENMQRIERDIEKLYIKEALKRERNG